MGYKKNLDKWLRVSVRRMLLDLDLEKIRAYMGGKTLEVGAGRKARRGDFKPPLEEASLWIYIDLNLQTEPHIQSSVLFLPSANEFFDSVICLEVLEYVDEPERALKELRRVIKLGGYLVLATPFLHRMDSINDLWRFTEAGLTRLIQKAGFKVHKITSQGAALAVVANIIKFIANSESSYIMRMFAGFLLRPLCLFLLWNDARLAKRIPHLTSFSTGYLVLAEAIK